MKFVENGVYLFYPKDVKEATIVQKYLFSKNILWSGESEDEVELVDQCVNNGMVVQEGKIFYNPCDESVKNGVEVDINSLIKKYNEDFPEKKYERITISGQVFELVPVNDYL